MTTRLRNPAAFFAYLRDNEMLGPVLTRSEVDGVNHILEACARADLPLSHTAYVLATVFHETAGTMQSIREYGSNAYFRRRYDIQGSNPALARRLGNIHPGDGIKYAGRSYPQLTGRDNYRRAGEALGLPLEEQPDMVLQPDIGAQILVLGMSEGWFTGKAMSDYLPGHFAGRTAFRKGICVVAPKKESLLATLYRAGKAATENAFNRCRAVVNGRDDAAKIADHALDFQDALELGELT